MSSDVPAAPRLNNYQPDEIILYGVRINYADNTGSVRLHQRKLLIQLCPSNSEEPYPSTKVTMAVLYGYAYEGHCYRLDRPKIVIFENADTTDKPAAGCGFGDGYSMWRIRSKLDMVELAITTDLAEQLILEANLPGNRAPNTYGNSMQLAHRGNRLSRNSSS